MTSRSTVGPQLFAVSVGLVPLGLAFGVLSAQSGFAWWWAPLFSVLIYAGSMEFLGVGLVLGGVSVAGAALTSLMVNFRHIFYGLTYPREVVRGRLARAYVTYSLTDETYAIVSAVRAVGPVADPARATDCSFNPADSHGLAEQSSTQGLLQLSGRELLVVHVVCQSVWVVSGIVGAVVSYVVPESVHGVEFALTALFIVLALESLPPGRWWLPVGAAALVGVVASVVVPGRMLAAALSAYWLLLLGAYVLGGSSRVGR